MPTNHTTHPDPLVPHTSRPSGAELPTPSCSARRARAEEARLYLAALFAAGPRGSLVELRLRTAHGMRQRFFPIRMLEPLADTVVSMSDTTDVFAGVLPRARRGGRRDDLVNTGSVLWADCDTPASAEALAGFELAPSMVLASGSEGRRHAYWFLARPVELATVERLNARLALALAADAGVVTRAQTILRPAGTRNHKHSPSAAVRLLSLTGRTYLPQELERRLPSTPASAARQVRQQWLRPSSAGQDGLRSLPPRSYFERLTGLEVPRSGKVRCPFHTDRTPSLHVYEQPERGWYSYGCGRGGSIYDLPALLWNRGTRGRDFIELRQELTARFG